jgi:hypothetical protein
MVSWSHDGDGDGHECDDDDDDDMARMSQDSPETLACKGCAFFRAPHLPHYQMLPRINQDGHGNPHCCFMAILNSNRSNTFDAKPDTTGRTNHKPTLLMHPLPLMFTGNLHLLLNVNSVTQPKSYKRERERERERESSCN